MQTLLHTSFSCPFLPKPLLDVGQTKCGSLVKGLTKLHGGRQWVFTQLARDALQLERTASVSY